jgi:hypothetical protein
LASGEDGTGELKPATELGGITRPQIHRNQFVPHFVIAIADGIGIANTELTHGIVTPAHGGVVATDCTSMVVSSTYVFDRFVDVHRRKPFAYLARSIPIIIGITEPELAIAVRSPTFEDACCQ